MSGAKSRQIATLEGQAWLQDPALHKVLEVLGVAVASRRA